MLCRTRAWTTEDLAAACGIEVSYLHVLKYRYLRDLPWIPSTDDRGRALWLIDGPGIAYRWITPEEGPVLQLLMVCEQYASLVRSYAEENARLSAQVFELLDRSRELEDIIVTERIRSGVAV